MGMLSDGEIEEREAKNEAIQLLMDVAMGKKGQEAVREWLLARYPNVCCKKIKKPVEMIPLWDVPGK